MVNGNIVQFPLSEDGEKMLGIAEWGWDAFMAVYDTISEVHGKESAWQVIHAIWQMRAGEELDEGLTGLVSTE